MIILRLAAVLLTVLLWPALAVAQGPSLFAAPDASEARLIGGVTRSLFDQGSRGLFSRDPPAPRLKTRLGASGIDAALFDVIASAEAGRDGYDAVQHGAKIRPPKPPTLMTLGDIFDWIKATPGQHHAIGRYQIIPKTLRGLVRDLDLPDDAVFDAALQDRLALELSIGAGYLDFIEGQIDRAAFMDNLARVWAGLPTSSGRSHYDGYAGNKATITRARFEAEMARIFPVE